MKIDHKLIVSFLLLILSTSFTGIYAQDETDDTSSDSTCVNLQSTKLKYKSKDQNTNGEVSTLQDYLSSIGLLNSQASGFYGLTTVSAMKSFQGAHHLKPTGSAGPLTRKTIHDITCMAVDTISTTTVTSSVPRTSDISSQSNSSEISWKLSSTSTDDISSFPLASDAWSDTLGVRASDISINNSYYVIFNRLSPLSGTTLKGKEPTNSLGGVNLEKFQTATNNGIRIDNLSLYYGTLFSPTKKTQYKLRFSNCDDAGAATRILVDKHIILSKECPAKVRDTTTIPVLELNKVIKPPVLSMKIDKETTVTLAAGTHTLEVEFMPTKKNAWTGLYDLPVIRLIDNADIVDAKSTNFSSLLHSGESFDLVSSGNSTSDMITLTFKKGYSPKNLVLSTNGRNITWDASAVPSSVEKIIILSNSSYSHVINAPTTATLYSTTESLLGYEYPLDPSSPRSFVCNPYAKACSYIGSIPMFLKQRPYTLKSMSVATGDTTNTIEVPSKTFTDNNDVQAYFKQLTEKSKLLQLGQTTN